MVTLAAGMAIAGGVLGLAKGISKQNQRKQEYEDKIQELERQQAMLDTQYSQAKESVGLATEQSKIVAAENKAELNLLATETIANRDMSIGMTAEAGSMQSEINAMQVATLAVQNQQQEGQARSQAASSGFRGTGTAMNLVDNATRQGDASMSQARMQSKVSNFQTYGSALSTYTSANQQAEAYERRIVQTEKQLERDLQKYDLQLSQAKETYDQKGGYLAADLTYLEGDGKKALGWARTMDVVGGVFSGAAQGYSMFS